MGVPANKKNVFLYGEAPEVSGKGCFFTPNAGQDTKMRFPLGLLWSYPLDKSSGSSKCPFFSLKLWDMCFGQRLRVVSLVLPSSVIWDFHLNDFADTVLGKPRRGSCPMGHWSAVWPWAGLSGIHFSYLDESVFGLGTHWSALPKVEAGAFITPLLPPGAMPQALLAKWCNTFAFSPCWDHSHLDYTRLLFLCL